MLLNEYDVMVAVQVAQRNDLPNLTKGAEALVWLVAWTNSSSDGWPYWRKPSNASKRLQERLALMIREEYQSDPTDCTAAELKAYLTPIKAFLTRQGVTKDRQAVLG